MDKNSQQYENITRKLRNLLKLAEQGVQGEASNARRLFDTLCAKYGLTMDDIVDTEKRQLYTFEIGRNKDLLTLFVQCHGVVTGERSLSYYQTSRSEIRVKLTAYQYAELKALWTWHKDNYKRERDAILETITEAYIGKHNLYRAPSADDEQSQEDYKLTAEELERLVRVAAMRNAMGDRFYTRMLGDGKEQ